MQCCETKLQNSFLAYGITGPGGLKNEVGYRIFLPSSLANTGTLPFFTKKFDNLGRVQDLRGGVAQTSTFLAVPLRLMFLI